MKELERRGPRHGSQRGEDPTLDKLIKNGKES